MIVAVLARFPMETLVIAVVQYNFLYVRFFQTGIRHSHSPGKASAHFPSYVCHTRGYTI